MLIRIVLLVCILHPGLSIAADNSDPIDLLEKLISNWDETPNADLRYQKLHSQVEAKISGKKAIYYADWLLSDKNPLPQPDIAYAINLLLKEAEQGSVLAHYYLVGNLFFQGERIGIYKEQFYKSLEILFDSYVLSIDDYSRFAFMLGYEKSEYFDLLKANALYDSIINKNPHYKLYKLKTLSALVYSDADEGLRSEIASLIDEVGEFSLLAEEKEVYVMSIVRAGKFINVVDTVTQSVISFHMTPGLSLSKEDFGSYMEFLMEQKVNNFDEILRAYTLSDKKSIWNVELIIDAFVDGWLDADLNKVTGLSKHGLHLYLSRSQSDTFMYKSPKELWSYLERGFMLSMELDDYDSALYFHEAMERYVLNDSSISPDLSLPATTLHNFQKVTLQSWWGEHDAAFNKGLEYYQSFIGEKSSNDFFRVELIFYLTPVAYRANRIADLLSLIKPFSEAEYYNKLDPSHKVKIKLLGALFSLITNDFDLYHQFDQIEIDNFEALVASETRLDESVNGLDLLYKVYLDKNYDAAYQMIKIDLAEEISKEGQRLDDISLNIFFNIINLLRKNKIDVEALQVQMAKLLVKGIVFDLSKGKILSPALRSNASNFLINLYDSGLASQPVFFQLYQLVQSHSYARSIHGKGLHLTDKKILFAHSNYGVGDKILSEEIYLSRPLYSLKEIQEALTEEQLIISAISSSTGSLSLLISPNGFRYVRSSYKEIEMVTDAQSIIDSISSEFSFEKANKIFDALFRDALLGQPKQRELYVSLPERINFLPASVLVTQYKPSVANRSSQSIDSKTRGFSIKSVAQSSSKVSWLIEEYAIKNIPFLHPIDQSNNKISLTNMRFLGVGAPVLKDANLDEYSLAQLRSGGVFNSSQLHSELISLPAADEELRLIANQFDESMLLTGPQATESGLFKALNLKFNVISFATHALKFDELIDTQEPSLVLTKTDSDDGLLSQSEVLSFDLSGSSLVLLSACNTSSSASHLKFNQFSGLASSFLAAGANNVLVTHWPVISDAARDVSVSFFKSKQVSLAKRLQDAIIKLIESPDPIKRSPAYWGAFDLIGI